MEHNIISRETWGDYTSKEQWELNGETYDYVSEYFGNGDGECHNVIVKRKSDGKFFEFCWMYDNDEYYYENYLDEITSEEMINNISGKEFKRLKEIGIL